MKRFVLAVALAAMPLSAQAQYLVDGTTPGAQTTLDYNYSDSYFQAQAFKAKGTQLASLSIWFYGGTYNNDAYPDSYALFALRDGLGPEFGKSYFSQYIDQRTQGRIDFVFASPIDLILGQQLTFYVYGNNCGSIRDMPCEYGYQPGPAFRPSALEVTTSDAYTDGYFYRAYQSTITNRDIRFEAVYIDEPMNAALIGAGVMLLGGMVVRRRRPR